MTATNMCSNFGGFRCGLPKVVQVGKGGWYREVCKVIAGICRSEVDMTVEVDHFSIDCTEFRKG